MFPRNLYYNTSVASIFQHNGDISLQPKCVHNSCPLACECVLFKVVVVGNRMDEKEHDEVFK